MGYIHHFEVKLSELLAEMDEAMRKEVLTYVKRTVVESYKNGIETGKAAAVVRAAERHKAPAGHGSHTSTPMDLKEMIRRAVSRSTRKAGNRYGETLKIELPAVELIAGEITAEVMDVFAMYTHNGGEAWHPPTPSSHPVGGAKKTNRTGRHKDRCTSW